MLTQLAVSFEHCYGIKKLNFTFDFSNRKAFSIYSPNGTMKTSFANSFKDCSAGQSTSDKIYIERPCKREIKDQSGNEIDPNQIFVIEPYVDRYKSEKTSTLLVNETLRTEYEVVLDVIDEHKSILIKKLKQLSGINNVEQEIEKIIPGESFLEAMLSLENEVSTRTEHPFSSITYSKIFEDKVQDFLNTKDFKKEIQGYIQRYDELLAKSKYLKKGFNHSNVNEIGKTLKGNNFFKANHSVNLHNGTSSDVITSEEDFENLVSKEIQTLFSDTDIQKKFNAIDSKLKNVQLRDFREYLFDNKQILNELDDLDKFKKEIWLSYLVEQKELFNKLLEEYKKGKTTIEEIVKKAKEESTDWQEVIRIFNKRFSVPFELKMQNQEDVILKSETPNLSFIFKDDASGGKVVEETELLKVLSQGERRALYLLNIIFEVVARRKANQETLFIVDDIADSFDYKNKYAIIEYLKDIAQDPLFHQIILTHNFDFYRTVTGRLGIDRDGRLNSIRTSNEIKIVVEKYQNNPFKTWKRALHTNNPMLLASIPFIRNLAEYSGNRAMYMSLTSLLHYKPDTDTLKISDLEVIVKTILVDKAALVLPNPNKIIKDLLFETADSIFADTAEVIDLENKILLSIAIRLHSEIFMVGKINDTPFWEGIEEYQTIKLIQRYKLDFPGEAAIIALLEQINLMTPENIHLNSFMYEPILDMANDHLKQLYYQCKTLLA